MEAAKNTSYDGNMDKDATFLKQAHSEQTECNETNETEAHATKQLDPIITIHDDKSETTTCSCSSTQDLETEVNNCKANLSAQKAENKELQEQLKEIISQSKLLKQENEKLINIVSSSKTEGDAVKMQLNTAIEKSRKSESEIKTLKSKLSEASSKCLILEEGTRKLKKNAEVILKEKSDLLDQLMKSTVASESLESKFENEISDLKNDLMKEMLEIKSQVQKSMSIPWQSDITTTTTRQSNEQPLGNETAKCQTNNVQVQQSPPSDRTARIHTAAGSTCKTAFIAGDDITRILSRNKMSDANLSIKIKSHPEGRLDTVENTLISMSQNEQDYICNTTAYVLHVGANNVSDGETPVEIARKSRDLADAIHSINPVGKIIISSILPRRNDKVVNNIISRTNQALSCLCGENSYTFLDNSPHFYRNGKPDISLYMNNIQLNAKGGKILGENMRQILNSVLSLEACPISVQVSGRQQQNFHKGRLTGRRNLNSQPMMYMPMPFFPPPWFQHSHNNQMNITPQ